MILIKPQIFLVLNNSYDTLAFTAIQHCYSSCLKRCGKKKKIPEDWSRAVVVPIFKKKDKTVCDNYRGISLLCHAEKVFASVVLQRIRKRTDEILTESQAGFRRGRSTIDQLFSLRLLAETYTCLLYTSD